MPFIPHSEQDIEQMLSVIGADSIEDLFDEIPADLRCGDLEKIPQGMNEMEVTRLLRDRAAQDGLPLCFLGAGAYEHHIPAAVWEITTRGEFYSAYTPYQAEASQGTLQLLYEFQSMMASLMGMDVSNASLYDGASALAEAVLMAVRANKKSKARKILMPVTTNPVYRSVTEAIVNNQDIELVAVPYDSETGQTDLNALDSFSGEDFSALVIPQPNFFGVIENVDALTAWAAENKMLSIAVVNPVAMALLKPPGEWGQTGVDIVCGEGQPLGVPLASGGPYFGFMCCKQKHVRQMPGRIIGRTTDLDGKEGFTLTLQAREQHIRRSKATSNICTNQGLLVTAATIYMSLLGPEGLKKVALNSHKNTQLLRNRLQAIKGVKTVFNAPNFHECVLQLDMDVKQLIDTLAREHHILAGFEVSAHYPELGNALMVCATETRTENDIEQFATTLDTLLNG
ncbi:aminomethyl-transferring glycine dehydrogenase subunit GcvPA [Cycloclasticus sp.]|uniref:aminomethyl-transferring glycine dehydrogenase subunit GcvPA n=1 Tax=Cycloclasticus sp. TaxID=2024830 RepID=UPI000C11692A|nr:aminomethyl-transferring glycine dehydrogenase subunit GcvPA [Cycloclasticus sp.]PHR50829.1 MAG: aminomethyl-transferring glycine dehydrogenase [Cycloclasticus sp.]